MTPILLYATVKNKSEALQIADRLLQEELIACANIVEGATSVYRWQGELQQETECLLIAKTTPAAKPRAMARMAALHSYDCPCILAFAADAAHAPFAEWIFSQIKD